MFPLMSIEFYHGCCIAYREGWCTPESSRNDTADVVTQLLCHLQLCMLQRGAPPQPLQTSQRIQGFPLGPDAASLVTLKIVPNPQAPPWVACTIAEPASICLQGSSSPSRGFSASCANWVWSLPRPPPVFLFPFQMQDHHFLWQEGWARGRLREAATVVSSSRQDVLCFISSLQIHTKCLKGEKGFSQRCLIRLLSPACCFVSAHVPIKDGNDIQVNNC